MKKELLIILLGLAIVLAGLILFVIDASQGYEQADFAFRAQYNQIIKISDSTAKIHRPKSVSGHRDILEYTAAYSETIGRLEALQLNETLEPLRVAHLKNMRATVQFFSADALDSKEEGIALDDRGNMLMSMKEAQKEIRQLDEAIREDQGWD